MTAFKGSKRGFTLIEIMIMVAIIALLAAMVIPNVRRARINANEMAAVKGLRTIHEILTMYLIINNEYPDSLPELADDHPTATALLTAIKKSGNTYHGYTFNYKKAKIKKAKVKEVKVKEVKRGFTCTAEPFKEGVTGNNRYRINQDAVLEIKGNGKWSSM